MSDNLPSAVAMHEHIGKSKVKLSRMAFVAAFQML